MNVLDYVRSKYSRQRPIGQHWYHDPYDDGKICGSGWVYEYPPVDAKMIEEIIARDKDCKPYIPDAELPADEKFNDEMAEKFTALMSKSKNSEVVDEFIKKNSHYYTMETEINGKRYVVIPMKYSLYEDFKKEAARAGNVLHCNYDIVEHKSKDDNDGRSVYSFYPHSDSQLIRLTQIGDPIDGFIRFCDKLRDYAKVIDKDTVEKCISDAVNAVTRLKELADSEYVARIKEYAEKCNDEQHES